MKDLIELLCTYKNYYSDLLKTSKKSYKRYVNKVPDNIRLRVTNCRGLKEYFIVTDRSNPRGTYLSKKNLDLARTIAQRDYEKRVMNCAEKWIAWAERVMHTMPVVDIQKINEQTIKRKELITPYDISDKEYIEQWESVTYEGKEFYDDNPEIFTEKGERVRSKSEKIIADKLYMMNIPYRYEYPLNLDGIRTIYPDFHLLNIKRRKEYILEHFGMMGDETYCNHAINKINNYIKYGYLPGDNLLCTYETLENPLDTMVLDKLLKKFILEE